MRDLLKTMFIILVALILVGCSNDTDNVNNQVDDMSRDNVMSKQDILLQFMESDVAEVLLVETWEPFKIFMESGNREISLEELMDANEGIHPNFLKNLYDGLFNGIGKDYVKIENDNFIPIISDEELEITSIELNLVEDEKVEYSLVIIEYGEYRDEMFGIKRESHFFVNEFGEVQLLL